MNIPRFFDDIYVSRLKALADKGGVKKLARPAVRLATDPGWASLRNEIDTFFVSLDKSSQTRLRKRRMDLENIGQTVNEIMVGRYLVVNGFHVEYEKDLGGFKPDWLVTTPNRKRSFVVEVFSKRDSDSRNLYEEFISDLRDECKGMTFGACLALRFYDMEAELIWSDNLVKDLARDIRAWLATKPLQHAKVDIQSIPIELCYYFEKIKHVELLPFKGAFWVNPWPVSQIISEKFSKYSSACSDNGLSIVAACCPSFSTAISDDDFERICPDLFEKHPELPGILAFIDGRVKYFENRNSGVDLGLT